MEARTLAAASAPGKVILHGEHAVVFGQRALAASLGLRSRLTVREAPGGAAPGLRLLFPSVGLDTRVPLEPLRALLQAAPGEEPQRLDHEAHLRMVDEFADEHVPLGRLDAAQRNAVRGFLYLCAGVLAGHAAALGCGVEAELRSQLTVGAGSGSSAAFAVCTAAALLQLRRGRPHLAALGDDDRRLVSAWAFNCERIMHGSPSGVDNWTSTLGGLVSFRRADGARALVGAVTLRVLLVDTRVSRQTRALAARVAERRGRHARALDAVLAACGHVADDAAAILEQMSSGDERELPAQYEQLSELWDMNHCLLAALGVSHPALEDVRRRAAARGLVAKLTGAGGGGYAIVLVPGGAAGAVEALRGELAGCGYGVTDTTLGGEGVALH